MVSRRFTLVAAIMAWLLCAIIYFNQNHRITGSQDLTTPQQGAVRIQKMTSGLDESLVLSHNSTRIDFSGLYHVPDDITWVTSKGDFLEKISNFNDALGRVRKDIIKLTKKSSLSRTIANPAWEVIVGTKEDYLDKLAKLKNVVSLALEWTEGTSVGNWSSLKDTNNLIQKYYPITATGQVCNNLKDKKPFTRHRYEVVFNYQCSSVIKDMFEVQSLDLVTLNALQMHPSYYQPNNGDSWPPHFYTQTPRIITFIHIVHDGVISKLGEVYTKKVKIIPYSCHPKNNDDADMFEDSSEIYDEVFTISQYWGGGFFHFILEDLPKLAPYQDFLVKNTNIKIHVYGTSSFSVALLEYLGISSDRLVTGSMRARIIYLPRATTCGFAQVPETQLLSLRMRQTTPAATSLAKTLVLIRRKGSRHFVEAGSIERALEKLAGEFRLEFFHFRDDPLPSMNATREFFNRAALVVAPHGAGLSNMIFAKPGTAVIEGLCNLPHVNLCYMRLMRILGHRYHGIMSRGGCEGHVDIPAAEIEAAARAILEGMKSHAEI